MRSFVLFFALALVAVPALSGCDESIPTDADDLLIDARIARQSGDIETAVELYERAHTVDESDAIVRVELASALLDQAELGIDDLDRVASYLLDESASGGLNMPKPATSTAAKSGGECPYETEAGAEPFDPRDFQEYNQYLDRDRVSRRVQELLDPVITDVLRPADFLCTGIENGELTYDADAALAALRAADSRLTDDQIAAALAMNAVAEAMDAYLTLARDLSEEADWYRLANGSLGICPVGVTEDELRDMAEEAIADLGEALVSIDLRAHILGDGQVSTELVDIVLDAYEEVSDDLAPFCGA